MVTELILVAGADSRSYSSNWTFVARCMVSIVKIK
jgi:hypothetical protein